MRHRPERHRKFRIVMVVCGLGTALVLWAHAQAGAQAGFRRTPVQQGDLSIPGRETVQAVAEIDPGAQSGRHTHPGDEIGYILEGEILLEVEGQPAVRKSVGEGFLIPSGAVHNARNTGASRARVLATYVIPKGQPVATPVP